MSTPRLHHYAFAHKVLRLDFLREPKLVVKALTEEGEGFLRGFWDFVGAKIREKDASVVLLPSDGLTMTFRDVGPRTSAIVITLPPPLIMPEAYFVALVYHRPRPGPSFHIGRVEPPPRYLTLELSKNFETGESCTVLGEWTATAHGNYGTGPEPTVDAFVARVKDAVDHR